MKRKNLIAVMGGWLALILASSLSVHSAVNASAATASAAGTLTGRVQNVGTGQ